MPIFESKFKPGDRVRVGKTDDVKIVQTVSFFAVGEDPVYYLSGVSPGFLGFELQPAPPEPEVWPKVCGGSVKYADRKTYGMGFPHMAERVAKLERLAWLVLSQRDLDADERDERWRLYDDFRQFHGPNGEVYLEPRKEPRT